MQGDLIQTFPRIKVCGITTHADLNGLASTAVDAIGLNFVQRSPRCISTDLGVELNQLAHELGLKTVAVLMNPKRQELDRICSNVKPDFIQLHGAESPSTANECAGIPVVKAISWSGRREEADLAEAWREAVSSEQLESSLAAFLVDAYAPVEGGGTGRMARWDLVHPRPPVLAGVPLILAGGLKPANVAEAIGATLAEGVDTASGVEIEPGKKDLDACKVFASNAVAALANM